MGRDEANLKMTSIPQLLPLSVYPEIFLKE
jgi:hypothetical protein